MDDLIASEILVTKVIDALTGNERRFLVSVKSGEPDFALLDVPGIERLPGLQWKIENVRRMDEKRRLASLEKLRRVLDI